MANKSTRGLIFNKIQVKTERSNNFDLSHSVKMSGKMGNLMPISVIECIPGDKMSIGQESIVRFAPLVSPAFHRYNVSIHNWFVPTRVLWPDFEKWISGDDTITPPYLSLTTGQQTTAQDKFLDYMGVPPTGTGAIDGTIISAIPFAAYQYIYNEKYRDQNLITEVPWELTNGDNNANRNELLEMRRVAWEHDYFTSALPQASFGANVDIPLGVVELDPLWDDASSKPRFEPEGGAAVSGALDQAGTVPPTITVGGAGINAYDPDGTLTVGATTIKDLRRAIKIQEYLELLGRVGKRYYELLKAFFDVNSKDARLQQPEYISGTKTPVVVSEVLNTTGTEDLPQGNMAGHAVSVGDGGSRSYNVDEHGYIIAVMFVTPKTAYMQGIPKTFTKFDQYDYFWPQFQHIGEQEIKNRELYAYTAAQALVWGYIPRYSEYKYMPDRVAGDFRSSLLHWTSGRKFATIPSLNQTFIEVDPDEDAVTRIFAVEDGTDYLYINILNKVFARRKMAVYGNPNL